ncbi:MAG: hypothetical protein J5741_05020 [Bacteroidales bacterium]|nr:hypothetical protein [Bacteroidales bacterium]
MKKMKKCAILVLLLMGMVGAAFAQAPYKHSVGATVGNFNAFSYKTFLTNHLALQLDLGYKYTIGANKYGNMNISTLELNPNLMYEGHFTGGLYGFIGGGVSLGYSWFYGVYDVWWFDTSYRYDYGKFGANGILGLEYKFNIPLTLQLDFRPGYGMLFNRDYDLGYFDWSANLGVRYTF